VKTGFNSEDDLKLSEFEGHHQNTRLLLKATEKQILVPGLGNSAD